MPRLNASYVVVFILLIGCDPREVSVVPSSLGAFCKEISPLFCKRMEQCWKSTYNQCLIYHKTICCGQKCSKNNCRNTCEDPFEMYVTDVSVEEYLRCLDAFHSISCILYNKMEDYKLPMVCQEMGRVVP